MATVNRIISQSSDDAENEGGIGDPYDETENDVKTAAAFSPSVGGYRFTNITIPQGSSITSAYIQPWVHTAEPNPGLFECYIWGVDVDNAQTWAETTNEPIDATKTTAVEILSINEAVATPQQRTYEITDLVQEIINREGWESGNGIAFITNHKTAPIGGARWGWTQWDAIPNGFFVAGLQINYSEPSATNMKINIGDVWKDVDSMKINIGDVWKDVAEVKQNIGDSWKVVF